VYICKNPRWFQIGTENWFQIGKKHHFGTTLKTLKNEFLNKFAHLHFGRQIALSACVRRISKAQISARQAQPKQGIERDYDYDTERNGIKNCTA
jgi:hypothetical protein